MMKLEKRIRALESKSTTGAVILHFADGSTRQICGRGDFLLSLFPDSSGGQNLSPAQAAQLELIRQSVDAEEPGGGHMIELLRALWHGPAEEAAKRPPDRGAAFSV
jgi:hypothetical protein